MIFAYSQRMRLAFARTICNVNCVITVNHDNFTTVVHNKNNVKVFLNMIQNSATCRSHRKFLMMKVVCDFCMSNNSRMR